MGLRRQPASRPPNTVTRRFTRTAQRAVDEALTARSVSRSGPRALFGTGHVARVLMRMRDRRVDRNVPGDLPGRIGRGEELMLDVISCAVSGVAAMPLPDRLPRPEPLSRKIAPRVPGAVPVDDAPDDLMTIPVRTPPPTIARRQTPLDLLPLPIRQVREPRLTDPDIFPRASPTIKETRPSGHLPRSAWTL